MTGAEVPSGRAEALERLRSGLDGLSDLADRLDAAGDDQERRSVLLAMMTAAWTVRDRAAEAYAALEFAGDSDGLGRGVLE